MPKQFRQFMQELIVKVGALPIVVQAKLRAPKAFSNGERLRAKQPFPVMCLFDHGHASGSFDLEIPEGAIVEYRGETMYADFSLRFPDDVLKQHGATLFKGHEWLLEHPKCYTLEVSAKFPLLILEKA